MFATGQQLAMIWVFSVEKQLYWVRTYVCVDRVCTGKGGPCLFLISFSDSLQTVDGHNLATVRAAYPLASPTFNIGAPQGPGPSKIQMKSVQDGFIPILNVGGEGGHLKSCKIKSINRLKKTAYP